MGKLLSEIQRLSNQTPLLSDRLRSEIQKLELTELMAEIDFRLVEGGGESIQLDALTARLSILLS